MEKLRYIHRNPVERGCASRGLGLEQFSYLSGDPGPVEIESQWTARRRELAGIFPTVRVRPLEENPRPSEAWDGAPSRVDDTLRSR